MTTAAIDHPTVFDVLYDKYCDWIDDLTEIRKRMEALRDENTIGWKPPANLSRVLTVLNREDEWYAARNVDGARSILSVAESDAAASKAHRLARIERAKERIAALERAYNAGWRPMAGLKPPHPAFDAWHSMFGFMRFEYLDDLETILDRFESLLPPRPKPRLGPQLLGRRKGFRK